MVPKNKEEILMVIGISKSLAISKRMKGIERRIIELASMKSLNYHSTKAAITMNYLA
jgi:hypothetical protein